MLHSAKRFFRVVLMHLEVFKKTSANIMRINRGAHVDLLLVLDFLKQFGE